MRHAFPPQGVKAIQQSSNLEGDFRLNADKHGSRIQIAGLLCLIAIVFQLVLPFVHHLQCSTRQDARSWRELLAAGSSSEEHRPWLKDQRQSGHPRHSHDPLSCPVCQSFARSAALSRADYVQQSFVLPVGILKGRDASPWDCGRGLLSECSPRAPPAVS